MFEDFRNLVRRLKQDIHALYLAARHPGTPWYAKLFVVCVVAYALSPIDLIPDFIPVLGYLDDFILIPAGIWIATRLIPSGVLDECRQRAELNSKMDAAAGRIAAAVIMGIWISLAGLLIW